MSDNNADKKNTHDYDAATKLLLESLGSTVANVETYESSVLQQATLDSAPLLTGIGFPPLTPLAPSYDARRKELAGSADAPHVQTLLQTVRTQLLQSQPNANDNDLVLRIKEQMLLTYLQTVARLSPEDMPVNVLRETSMEWKRSQRLNSSGSNNNNKKRSPPIESTLDLQKTDGTVARSVASSSATASFGTQALLLEQQERPTKRRTSMMRLKQNAQTNQTPNEEDAELKKMLKQRRKERLERKRKRHEQWELSLSSSDNSNSSSSSSEEEEEMEFDDTKQTTKNEPVNESLMKEYLTCPICNQQVEAGDSQEDSDAKLSQHMQLCQKGGRPSRRARARNETSVAPPAVQAKRLSKKKTKSRRRKIRKQPTKTWKNAVDDFDEWDYEDRVDDWIAHGRERMVEITERDATETPPGTVALDHDLVIPGWMNNRLFPYQRTGLKWMWDLHLQEAGGVVGDEMVLCRVPFTVHFLLP